MTAPSEGYVIKRIFEKGMQLDVFEIIYIVFLVKMKFLQIKKSSDALLKSDARADQNQVIFFTSPKGKRVGKIVEYFQGVT